MEPGTSKETTPITETPGYWGGSTSVHGRSSEGGGGRGNTNHHATTSGFRPVKPPILASLHHFHVMGALEDAQPQAYKNSAITALEKIVDKSLCIKTWKKGYAQLDDNFKRIAFLNRLITQWVMEETNMDGEWKLVQTKRGYRFEFLEDYGTMNGMFIRLQGMHAIKDSHPAIYKVFMEIMTYFTHHHHLNVMSEVLEYGIGYENMQERLVDAQADDSGEAELATQLEEESKLYAKDGLAWKMAKQINGVHMSREKLLALINETVPKNPKPGYHEKLRRLYWRCFKFIQKYPNEKLLQFYCHDNKQLEGMRDNGASHNADHFCLCWDWDYSTDTWSEWTDNTANECGVIPFCRKISLVPGEAIPKKSYMPVDYRNILCSFWDICRKGPVMKKVKPKRLIDIL